MNITKSRSLPKLFCLLFIFTCCYLPAPAQPKNAAPKIKPPAALSLEEIAAAKVSLHALGYWLNLEASGIDASSRHALIAFQKVEGRKRTGKLTIEELTALQSAQKPMPMEAGDPHIEVDLNRQVLFVVEDGGVISRILPISSGSGELYTQEGVTNRAVTPLGRFKIQRKILGWRKSPLGLLYFPNYFYGGYAIHGNPAVPAFPASHGCIRIPMFASEEFSALATVGMPVIVHDGTPLPVIEKLPITDKLF